MRILRASDRTVMPWKNGGGVTTEVAVFPQGAGFDDFGWRVSIAQINRGGPFSIFPDIDRELGMLEGSVALTIGGRDAIDLSPDAEPVHFPGDVLTGAELVSRSATDLNVMTRRGVFASRMTRSTNIVVESGVVAVFAFPLRAIIVRDNGMDIPLSRGDALFFGGGESPALPDADFYQIAIFPAEKPADTR